MSPNTMQGPHWVTAVAPDTTNPATFGFVAHYLYNGAGTDTGASTGTSTDASTSPSAASVLSPVTSHSSSSSEGPSKRGPGRPPKNPLCAPLPEGVEAPPKRGRGRPPKNRPVNGENPPPKRGRGRPPKNRLADGEIPPPKRPRGRPPKVKTTDETARTPENPAWSQNLNPGLSPVLEDPFPPLPPLQVPEMSAPPKSLPWDVTPTLESLELRMWSPQRTMVPAAPPQPSIPLRDGPIIWRDWLVDDIVDSWDYLLLLKANLGSK
jgi:hypothetical protein